MCSWFTLALTALICGVASQKPLSPNPLRNFQVSQPLHFPKVEPICTTVLIKHVFGDSFGQPAIVQYKPPEGCGTPGSWAAVSLNFTGTSKGVQFDRLSSLYLSGVEIWRTSTPEPTTEGIIWTAMKDVSKYIPLFSAEGTLLLDLGNLLNDGLGLTGEYNVTLIAQFYTSDATHPPAKTADIILPLSQASRTQGSAFVVPPAGDTAIISLPRNIMRAFVEIYASGNANEEFWYGNVPDEFFPRLPAWNAPDGQANPKGPFREVQLLIDDTLAGVVFPYPVIYSGEFLPSIWRPMLSYGALDSPTYYIDITPFVPRLCDGAPHNFTLDVVGMGTNFSINSNWIVSGNLQLLLDDAEEATKGEIFVQEASRFIQPVVSGSVAGPAPNVSVTTSTNRTIRIQGRLTTGSGKTITTLWHQQLEFTNTEVYSTTMSNVNMQRVTQSSSGSSLSRHDDTVFVVDNFNYPFSLDLTYFVRPSPLSQTFFDYGVTLEHSFQRQLSLANEIGGFNANIDTTQTCEGTEFQHVTDVIIRTGRTREQFAFRDHCSDTYFQDVEVETFVNITTGLPRRSNSSLIYNHEGGSLAH